MHAMNYFPIFVDEKSLRYTLLTNLFMKRTLLLCLADLGLSFVIPFWRMGIVLDGAFNYLLTDNYLSVNEQRISRFYATGSVGLIYRF